ncbi:MAG: bifunctional amidotransferase subunit GatB/aspartate--tRNA ligase AspS [Flavobacteriales bacterium]
MELTHKLDQLGLEVVIGLETHIRLNTKTKLFCACANQESSVANANICSVCTGQMGVLPAINSEAIRKAILFGKTVKSSFKNEVICWDRKHYEYPDQPKNFQLTQFQKPIIPDGEVKCFREDGSEFSVQLEQVHLEEDAAKLMHEKTQTLVDFNKSGVPLIEVVTKPCIRELKDASLYAQYLQRIVQNLGISEANLEMGEFKSDVSVSLRKKGTQDLNPRTEIKNLNSFKFMIEALEEEVTKQLDYYTQHNAFRPDQTTVLFDADLKKTKTMRKKEFAADYRYALEPDIPFVNIKKEVENTTVDENLLPYANESIMIKAGVRPQDAKYHTGDPVLLQTFIAINKKLNDPLFIDKALRNNLKSEDYPKIKVEVLTDILGQYKDEKITIILVQKALEELIKDSSFNYEKYFVDNTFSPEKLKNAVLEAINENPEIAKEIKAGNQGKAGVLVGKVTQKLTKGVNGKLVREIILQTLQGEGDYSQSSETKSEEEGGEVKVSAAQQRDDEEAVRAIPVIIKDQYRTHVVTQISQDSVGKSVTLSGWVSSLRDHGDLVFIDFRDASYEVLQLSLKRETFPQLDQFAKLKPESVIMVTGNIILRGEDDYNSSIRTGKLEMEVKEIDILNLAKTLPFEIKRAAKTNEATRLKYKFLDHRSIENRTAIINRHKVIKLLRDILDREEFIEVETPVLTAGTEEGAREFIVPSRKYAGSFYTLPQAPQQFKQLLMVGGFQKYFQVARCFRDEDSRGDRQPEFTQLDMEMAFLGEQDIMDLNTKLLTTVVKELYSDKWKMKPFQVIKYWDSMEKYGCDRPDMRYGLELQTITDIVKDTTFQVFSKPIEEGGVVKCIKVDAELQKKRLSKGQIEKLTALAQENGLGGLAYIIVNENDLQSPIIKFLGEEIAANIIKTTKAKVGDIVFFSAASYATANKALDQVRQELGRMLNLINPKELAPVWVVDFPFFEKTDEGRWTFTHNPFSMPKVKDLDKHMSSTNVGDIIAQQYDLVLNGYEIGGGSVRAHKAEILEATYRNMGYNKEEMKKSVGHMYEAFQYGAPPHGGIAWGLDRLMMILERKVSIREVMAYPKTGSGEDLMFNSPSVLSSKKVEEMNIRVI